MSKPATGRAGWTNVAFGDVVRLATERSSRPELDGFERFVGLEHIEPGDLRIRRWGDIADGTTFTSVFRPGQVLFGKRRAYQRKVAVADFSGICSGDIYVLEPKGKGLLPELLPFICQTDAFFEHAIGTSAGSLSPRTNWTSLSRFEFALPHIGEQRRIVSVLGAVENAGHNLRRLGDALRSTELSLARELFPQPGHSTGVRLADFAKEDIKKVRVDPLTSYRAAGVLNEGKGLFAKDQLLGSKTNYDQLIVLRHNQLVMRKLTAWEGAIAVVPKEFDGAVVSTEFPTVTLDERIVLPQYMSWVLRQPWFWREMKSRCRGTALRRSRLHQRDLLEISVRVPHIDEQRMAIAQIAAARSATDEVRARAQQLRLLLESYLGVLLQPGDSRSTGREGAGR
jgi:type I restriction enzyme S subunit